MFSTTPRNRQGLHPAPAVSSAINRNSKLPPDQEAELILSAQSGDRKARQQVITANLAWICLLGGSSLGKGLDDDELLSEGVIALDRAIDQWRPEFGADIRTYSKAKILKVQSEAASSVDPIRVPKSAQEQRVKLRKTTAELGGKATVAQLAEQTQIREQRIEELQSINQPISLNIFVGKGDTELLDLQADNSDTTLALELESALEHLEIREQEIIRLRFLGGFTFQEIGDLFNLTNQRIQQIYKAALERLRVWLMGEKPEDLVQSQEFPIATQPIPIPALWEHLVFAKFVLANGFSRILAAFTRNLKRKTRPCQQKKLSLHGLENLALLNQTAVLPADGENLNCQNQAALIPHRIKSGGLRDGPKCFLDNVWRGLYGGLAQFLGYWPGSPRGSDQPRCCIRDFHRGKGQVERCAQKEKLISRIYCNAFLISFYAKLRSKTKPKTKSLHNIISFSRYRNNSRKCLLDGR